MSATRYQCSADRTAHCTRGNGRPTRKACKACGSRLYVQTGTWGVFVWTGDGRYPIGNAVRTFAQESRAEAFTTQDDRYVVRWIAA